MLRRGDVLDILVLSFLLIQFLSSSVAHPWSRQSTAAPVPAIKMLTQPLHGRQSAATQLRLNRRRLCQRQLILKN